MSLGVCKHFDWDASWAKGVFVEPKRLSSNRGVRLRSVSWPAALIAILVVRAVVSYAAKPRSHLLSYGSISYFLLLLLAAGFPIRNAIQNALGSRPSCVLLALCYSLLPFDQSIF